MNLFPSKIVGINLIHNSLLFGNLKKNKTVFNLKHVAVLLGTTKACKLIGKKK